MYSICVHPKPQTKMSTAICNHLAVMPCNHKQYYVFSASVIQGRIIVQHRISDENMNLNTRAESGPAQMQF